MKQPLDPKIVIGVIAAVAVILVIVLISYFRTPAGAGTAAMRPGQAPAQSPAEVQARHEEVQQMRADFKQEMADRRAHMGHH